MFNVQNKQLQTYLTTSYEHKFLKFCYFILLFALFACGEAKTEKAADESHAVEQPENTSKLATKTILCFGDSLTAGYGLNDSNDGFTALLQQKIDSANLAYTVINSGVSGETTAGGKSRIDWVIKQAPTLFILELGANDGLRGVPLSETRANLQAIIDVVKEKSPKTSIILAGMELPPNMGQDYTTEFRQLFADLAEKNSLVFIPFILKDVGGIAELNQKDGIHPNIEGHKIVANTVWDVVKPLITPSSSSPQTTP